MSTIEQLPAGVEWLHEETEEELDDKGWSATARFWMPWAARMEFARVCGGLVEQFSIAGVTFSRIVPLKYPFYDNCWASRVRLRGEGSSRLAADGLSIAYDHAIATVSFTPPSFRFDGDRPTVSESAYTACEMVTRPGTAYKFPSDNAPLATNAGAPVATSDINLTFHQIPSLNWDLYASLSGYVNTTTFYGRAAGTMQYVGPSHQGQRTVGGVASWQVTHQFRFRAVPHNQLMRPDGAGFEAPVQVGDTSKYLLPTADLNLLWGG
jgi:hypothetical protein